MKIVIVNAHWSNRGDEAALRVIINKLQNEYNDCMIDIIFKDDKDVIQFPYGQNITHTSLKFLPSNYLKLWCAVRSKGRYFAGNDKITEFIRRVAEADVIIYAPGGAVICSRFWWKKQLEYLLPFMCANIFHLPIVVAAPSIGPFSGGENNHFRNGIIRRLLKKSAALCVREEISLQYLKEIGVNNAITTIDTAFYDSPNLDHNAALLSEYDELNQFMLAYKKVVGLTLSDFSWHVSISKNKELIHSIKDIMTQFIAEMNQQGIGVLLIPQLFGNQNDTAYLETYVSENTFIISDQMDTYFQQYVISRLYALVGMRYHSCIFAAKMGTPFISIAYEEKMKGFMQTWNLEEYLIDLDTLSYPLLKSKWALLEAGYQNYNSRLCSYHNEWKNEAEKTLQHIMDVISSTT